MNICHIIPKLSRSGAGVFAALTSIVNNLDHVNNQISVYSCFDEHSSEDNMLNPNINVIFAKSFFADFDSCFSFLYNFRANIYNFDLMHSHGLWHVINMLGCYFFRNTGRPYIVSPHGMLDEWALNNSKIKKKFARLLVENKNISNSSCIHALCHSEYVSIRKCGFHNPICVIPNGVSLPGNSHYPYPQKFPQDTMGKKILLYLGRIHPKKGIENLVRAWGRIKSEEPSISENWCFVIAGWGQDGHEKYLEKYAQDSQFQDIHFIGPQFDRNKESVYFHSDAFIIPSYSEGLPMVVLEAWSHKLPVLMTPECNIPEGFEMNAAIKINTDENSIYEGLYTIFSMNDCLRKKIGLNGYSLVKSKFSWTEISMQFQDVYKWCLDGKTVPSSVILD